MSKFWSQAVNRTEPYIPGEQPKVTNIIKLNTNENPYPPSSKVLDAIKAGVNADLRLYPSPVADNLRKTAALVFGLHENQVFVGNGSDEVLAFSFQAFFNPGEKICFPDISYSFYPVYAKLYGVEYKEVALNEDFTIPIEQFYQSEGGVIFPNPNAPTGLCLPLSAIKQILNQNKAKVVIIDEAYVDFGGESAVSLVNQFENLLVVQTLSKSRSLAGMRVGFAFGSEQLIEGLNRIKNSFNSYTLDRLALIGAQAALEDEAYFKETVAKIVKTRERVRKELTQIGYEVLDSKTNFLFIKHEKINAKFLYESLKEQGIYVRYFNRPRIDQYIRVTIGNDIEMDQFLAAAEGLVEACSARNKNI